MALIRKTALGYEVAPPGGFKVQKEDVFGLGDLVALKSDPIKRAIIAAGPEWLEKFLGNCGCPARRAALNRWLAVSRNSLFGRIYLQRASKLLHVEQ